MEKRNSILPVVGQLMIYAIIMGITLISVPKTSMSYLVTRAMQLVEVLAFLVLLVPRVQKIITVSRFSVYVNIWWIIYLFITYIRPHELGLTPIFWWLHIGVFLLLGSCYWVKDFQTHLKWMTILLTSLIYLNAVLLILHPDGLWIDENWVGRGSPIRYLFGNYNQIGFVGLLGLTTHSIYTFYTKKGYFNLYILTAVALFSVIFVGSMTSTIGLLILAIYILFHRRIKRPLLLVAIFGIIYIASFVFIIWLGNSIEEFAIITDFVENTLHKDTTFSKRTDIWKNAVKEIAQSPLIGYGIQDVDWNDEHLGGSGPHNLWLMLLLQGGLVSCIGFIWIVVYTIKSALQTRSYYTIVAIVAMCVLLVMSMFETYSIVHVFILVQIIYYSSMLTKQNVETNKLSTEKTAAETKENIIEE